MPSSGGFPKNVGARIESLNPENNLQFFLKIKEVFTKKLKIISVDHDFQLHQTPANNGVGEKV